MQPLEIYEFNIYQFLWDYYLLKTQPKIHNQH